MRAERGSIATVRTHNSRLALDGMGATQSGLLGNSLSSAQSPQNGRVDLARLRSAIREQNQQDPTKQQLYALLLKEYKSSDDEQIEARTPSPLTSGTPNVNGKTEASDLLHQSDVVRKSPPNCCADGDDANKTSDGDNAGRQKPGDVGRQKPGDVGDVAKTFRGGLDDKSVTKRNQTSGDGLPENRKRSICSDIIAPKKKFLHGFRNRSNSTNESVCSDGDAKTVAGSVASSRCSSESNSSVNDARTVQSNANLESRNSTPETPGGSSSSGAVPMPASGPNNLRIRNVIETLMNTDMIRHHLEYDGPDSDDARAPAPIKPSKSIDARSFGSEDGSPRPLEPQIIQNQMQKALLMDSQSHSPSGDGLLHSGKPVASAREHAGPLQLIKEQVISISPGRDSQTASVDRAPYRFVPSAEQFEARKHSFSDVVVLPEATKQGWPQFAYGVHSAQTLSGHAQFASHMRQYLPAGISTGRVLPRSPPGVKTVAGGGADQWGTAPSNAVPWFNRRSMTNDRGEHIHQPAFRPAEVHPAEGRPNGTRWIEGHQTSQEVQPGRVNICPQIVDKNMTTPDIVHPGFVYRTPSRGSLIQGCGDPGAAVKSLMLQRESTGNQHDRGTGRDHQLMSPNSRYDTSRQSHDAGNFPMLKRPVINQLHSPPMTVGASGVINQLHSPPMTVGASGVINQLHSPPMTVGASGVPMNMTRPHDMQRSPPGAYRVRSDSCGEQFGHAVSSLKQPIVTSRPHSRYDTMRWELGRNGETSPVQALNHRVPTPGNERVELTPPADAMRPPALIPLTAQQSGYSPPGFPQRSPSQMVYHQQNGAPKPGQGRKGEKESPLDLSGAKDQFVFVGSRGAVDSNTPLDLSVKTAPVDVPVRSVRVEDMHYKKREVSRSFVHHQQMTPAGDAGNSRPGSSPAGFPNMSQHILKLEQSINRAIQDNDETMSHRNQPQRQNVSPESPLLKHYQNLGMITHRPPMFHVPMRSVPVEYPIDGNMKSPLPLPPPASVFPSTKNNTQKAGLRYGAANILGNHAPNDILYFRCNLCGQTYGSQPRIKRHFSKVHGRDPTPQLVAVQTISDMRNAILQEKLALSDRDDDQLAAQKRELSVEQHHEQQRSISRKPEEAPELLERDKVEREKVKRQEEEAKNYQALSLLRKGSQRIAKAILVKRDSDSENKSNGDAGGGEKSMMKCLQCGQDFPTRDWGVFRRHVRTHDLTPDAIYKCTVCSVGFKDAASRRSHMSTEHSITSCMCRKCNIGFTHIGALNKHLKTAHVDGQRVDVEYRCLYCPKYFAAHDDLILHTKRHETNGEQNSDVAPVVKTVKAVPVHPMMTSPHRLMTPDTTCVDSAKFPYPDLTIVEDPIVIENNKKALVPPRSMAVMPPRKPLMPHNIPSGKTLQEMLLEKIEPQGKQATIALNGKNFVDVSAARLSAQRSGVSQMVCPVSNTMNHDQNMKRRLVTDKTATAEHLSKKVKAQNMNVDEINTSLQEQAKHTAQSLPKDIVKTAGNSDSSAKLTAASITDKDTKVTHIMQGVLRSFPVLRHKPENIREVIETLVTAELTGELPRRFTTDPARDITVAAVNAGEGAISAKLSQKNDVRVDAAVSVSSKDSIRSTETLLSNTSEMSVDQKESETPRRDISLEKSPQDGGVLTKTFVSPKEDLRDILPVKDSPVCVGVVNEKAVSAEKMASVKIGDRKPGKLFAKRAEASSLRQTALAGPSTSGRFNPLMGLQFSDFHPTLCTDHACEGNYLETKHGHEHHHGHCHDDHVARKKEKLDTIDNGGTTKLESDVQHSKAGEVKTSGKTMAKTLNRAVNLKSAASSSAGSSSSGQFNPLKGMQFTDFHPTLCTDHACEGNYLETKHGHHHGHCHEDDGHEHVPSRKNAVPSRNNAAPPSAGPSTLRNGLQFTDFHPTLCTDHACEGNYLETKHGHDHGHCHDHGDEHVPSRKNAVPSRKNAAPPGAGPSTSRNFNPLKGMQFTDFHPTLCTDHACEGNYLETKHGHHHGHCHDDHDAHVTRKETPEDAGNELSKSITGPFEMPRQHESNKSVTVPFDMPHLLDCKGVLAGKTSTETSSSTVMSDTD